MNKKTNISQSDIKTWEAYEYKGECGIITRERLLNGLLSEPSEAMRLGIWFEYYCTGAFPKSGKRPIPENTKTGKLTAEYERMHKHSENYYNLAIAYKESNIHVGKYIANSGLNGTLDMLIEHDGKYVIIDIKTSGMFDDKWNDLGWSEDGIEFKDSHSLQALQYKLLVMLEYDLDYIPDFYFWVFSTKNEFDYVVYKAEHTPEQLERHIQRINATRSKIENETEWIPRPKYTKCRKCQLFDTCEKAHKIPQPINVHFQ